MCLDSDSEGCGMDRRDFLIGGAAAFVGLGALLPRQIRSSQIGSSILDTRVLEITSHMLGEMD